MPENSNTFIDIIDLPSKFLPYNEKELRIRPFKIGEVKKLNPVLNKVSSLSIIDVVENVISPIDPKDLVLGDFWFIMAWLRVNTFKSVPITIQWICPVCKHTNSLIIDLTKLKVHELDSNYKEPVYTSLPSGKEIPLRLSRVGDELRVNKFLRTILNKEDISEEESFIPNLAITIDNGKSLDTNIKYLEALAEQNIEDLMVIQQFQQEFMCGLPSTLKDTCKGKGGKCGYESDRVRFDFHFKDLIPTGQYSGHLRNAVRFGKDDKSDSE